MLSLNDLSLSEFRFLALLIKNSEEQEDDNFFKDIVEYSMPLKNIKSVSTETLFEKGILASFSWGSYRKSVSYSFTSMFKRSDFFINRRYINLDVINKLNTKSGAQLYISILSNGEVINDNIVLKLTLDELRTVFNCQESTYRYYKDIRVRKLDPAINDLNIAGYDVNYDAIRNGTKVDSVNIYKKVPKKTVYKDIEIDKDLRIQEAIGRICEVLFLYSLSLNMSPKSYEEYLLNYAGNMCVSNRGSDSYVRVKVFRSDIHEDLYPLVITAILEDNNISYKISYKANKVSEYNWIIKDEYKVLIALENIKYALLQGKNPSDINIANENALHVHLNNRPFSSNLEHRWDTCFEIPNEYKLIMKIMDEFNEKHKDTFQYFFLFKSYPKKYDLISISIYYGDTMWNVTINDEDIHLNKYFSIPNDTNSDYTVFNFMELFKIICDEDVEEDLYNMIEKYLSEFTE